MRPIAAPEGKCHDTACIPSALFPPKIGLSCLYCLWRSWVHPAGSTAWVEVKSACLQPAQGQCWHMAPQPWFSVVKDLCPPSPCPPLPLPCSAALTWDLPHPHGLFWPILSSWLGLGTGTPVLISPGFPSLMEQLVWHTWWNYSPYLHIRNLWFS